MKTDTMMTQEEVRNRGMDALKKELGTSGMLRFLHQFETGKGNYTIERRKVLDHLSLKEILRGNRSRRAIVR
jgi:hypothetical protein